MNLDILSKVKFAFQSFFSSFMSIELFIIGCVLFCFLFINLNKNDKVVKVLGIFLYLLFFISICFYYSDYTVQSVDAVIKYIMNYIYFPSLAMYFMIMIFVTIAIIYTIFSKKMPLLLKRFNICVFSLLYLMYIQVIGQVAGNRIYFTTDVAIYKNETILSLVQVSNFLLVIWILFMVFYFLYKFFKKKLDERFNIT